MERTLTFEKDTMHRWYAVIPEWTGSKDELQMVMGADTLLDIMAQGENIINVQFSTSTFDSANKMVWYKDGEDIGGGFYILDEYLGIKYNLDIWLCDVTKFVFGDMPKFIYVKCVL